MDGFPQKRAEDKADRREDNPEERPGKVGPWTRLSGRQIYDNPWIRVREDQVLHPDGSPGIYGTIHFKHMAIGVVPIDREGRVVLVGQHRYAFNRYFWEIPQGGCPIGKETPEISAMRELKEETGFTAGRWDYLGALELSNSCTDEAGHLYLARDLTAGDMQPEASEEITVKRVDFQESYRLAMEGGMNESISVAALARAKYFLEWEASLTRGNRPVKDGTKESGPI